MIAQTGCPQPGDPHVYTERRVPPFDLKIAESGRMLLGRVSGPLDATTAETFEQRLRPHCARSGRVVLDLRLADYVDSTGVRSLLALQNTLQAAGGELRLVVQPGSRVDRTLALLQLADRFAIYATASDAWVRH